MKNRLIVLFVLVSLIVEQNLEVVMSDRKNNLNMWDDVSKVDAKYTKQAKVDGNPQTSIAALYPVYLMTKALGPIGELWRYKVVSQEFVNTQPVKFGKELLLDNGNIVWEQDHTLFLRIETRKSLDDDFEMACEQYGHTKYRYMSSKGYMVVDHEYAKKSCSDALKKCLTMFGVCADVFMGDFDDKNYQYEIQQQIEIEKADKNNDEELKLFDEMKKEIEDAEKALAGVPNEHAAKKVYALKARYFKPRLNSMKFKAAAEKYLKDLDSYYKSALERLSNNKDAA